ncbi:MAG: class I SAM-dependent methyltransferase [Candidatus Margulisbacteria bacterium]|nr:class I SAM-dependent methyltransferase [Candidatus Margulisiibacteriota bacterium]
MMLANRLIKRFKIMRKWAAQNNITCFRLYDKDIPEYPVLIDWYAGQAVVWIYHRKKDDTEKKQQLFTLDCIDQIKAGLDLKEQDIILKKQARQRGSQNDDSKKIVEKSRIIDEQGLKFEVDLYNYLDTGLFLDHRNTRNMVRTKARDKDFLNLYAYTGSFTCYAAAGEARSTVTVDLSNTYSKWAVRNMAINGFEVSTRHRIVTSDCFKFLKESVLKGKKYDLIVCDPPSFSNSKKIDYTFILDRDYVELLNLVLKLLKPEGELFFSTNFRNFNLDETRFPSQYRIADISERTVPFDFRNKKIHQCWIISEK